ncbi:response regulator transcription factor [Cohnella soli]|uniref:Response regulator n=1 Tax=Cohnella soli TaxID=425005 RepID=A0ABW0HLJ5_9BACL
MLKVLLIDDEKWVVQSLKTIVDWRSLGYEIIAEAFNGVDGYEQIKKLSPDLVLTDIRMPGMDGLELIRQGSALNRDIGFIVTSGYKEFEYARKALQYGALSYLLKPFDEEEFAAALEQFGQKHLKNKAMWQMELLNRLQDNDTPSGGHLQELMMKLGFEWDVEVGAAVAVVVGPIDVPIPTDVPYLALQIGKNVKAYIVKGDCMAALVESFDAYFPEDVAGIGISSVIYDSTQLMDAIGEANAAAHQFFVTGNRGIWHAVLSGGGVDEVIEILWKLHQTRSTTCVDELSAKIKTLIAESKFTIRNAVSLYNWVLLHVYKLEEEQLWTYQQLANRFGYVNDMMAHVESMLRTYCDRSGATASSSAPVSTFNKIVAYIDEHFREDLSLQTVSETMDVHPSYVSQLFRKEASETFLQHVTRKRMVYASKLLKETNLSVQEIAESAGYLDYFHFAKTFKKMMGQTASQYREIERGPS